MNKKKPAKLRGETPNTRISSPQLHEYHVVTLANAITTRLLWKIASKNNDFNEYCKVYPEATPHSNIYDIYAAQFFDEYLSINPFEQNEEYKEPITEVVGNFLNDRAVKSIQEKDMLKLAVKLKDTGGDVLKVSDIHRIVKEEFARITNPERCRG